MQPMYKMERSKINETILGVVERYRGTFNGTPEGLTEFYNAVTTGNYRLSVETFDKIEWGASNSFIPGIKACAKIVIDGLLKPEDAPENKMTFNRGVRFMLEQDLDQKLIKAIVQIASARYNKDYKIGRTENKSRAKKLIEGSSSSSELIVAAMELYRNA